MIEIKELKLTDVQGSASKELSHQFDTLSTEILQSYDLHGAPQTGLSTPPQLVEAVKEFFQTFEELDNEYGEIGPISLDDSDELTDYCLRCLAELRNWLNRLELNSATPSIDKLIIGAALWTIRHEGQIMTPEPVVNALACGANDATTKQELAAIFGLTQGLISAIPDSIKVDLEKSNPARPWRILLLNFAIVAIRTQDAVMIGYALDTLSTHLPEEYQGFLQEAAQQAAHPMFSDEVKELIQTESTNWTLKH